MSDSGCCEDDVVTFAAVNTAFFNLLITVLNADGTPYGFIGRTITILLGSTAFEPSLHTSSTTNGDIVIQDDSNILWSLTEDTMVELSSGSYLFDVYDDTDSRAFMFRAIFQIDQGVSETGPPL
jgi:hypothetical protein